MDATRKDNEMTLTDKIIDILEENDFGAKEWTADEHTRVYVTRTLSRGRRQEMGYISVAEDGSLDYCLTRASARIRSLVEKGKTR